MGAPQLLIGRNCITCPHLNQTLARRMERPGLPSTMYYKLELMKSIEEVSIPHLLIEI